MPPLLKRKSRQEAFKRCYEQAVQQLGPRPANPPTVAAPPLESLSTLAPPIIRTADPPPNAPTPPECEGPLISARRAFPKEGSKNDPPKKMAKGLIKGLKAEVIVRRTGKNIEVKYVDSVHGPQTKELNSLLTKDIGRVIRNSVAMNQPTWWELKEEERLKLCTALSICYEIEYDQKMYDWLMKVANKTYTSWKAKLTSFLSITKGKRLRKSLCKEEGWMSGIGLSNTSCHLSFRNSQLQTQQIQTN